MRLFHIAIALLLSLSYPARYLDAQSLTLDAALGEAIGQRPDLQVFAMQVAQREAAIRKLRVDYLPQVQGDAQVRFNFINPVSVLPANIFNPDLPADELVAIQFGTDWAYSAGLTLTQPLLDPTPAYRIQTEALAQEQIRAQARDAESRILAAVTEAYYGVLLGEAEIAQAQADSVRAAAVCRDLEAAAAEGRALPAAVAQARLGLRQAGLQIAQAEHNLLTLKELLLTRMGRPLEEAAGLRLDTSLPELLATLQAGRPLLSHTGDRYEWEQLRLNQRQLELDRQFQQRAWWPELSLTGYLGANHFSNRFEPFQADQWFASSYVGLNVGLPLTDLLRQRRELARLDWQEKVYQEQGRDLDRQLAYEVADARTALEMAWASLGVQDTAVTVAEAAYAEAQARFQAGKGTQQEMIRQAALRQQAGYRYLQAAYEVLRADLRLRQAQGILRRE